ncbi:phosphoinositide phospholipase C [Trichonephila inaurata madagascariensis]|uniref:Phosphoinositide phospholipase C n=1 Tax=Trichonephila inaurata madagascariensis TaxID=2747483 RepID=A0A8X6WTY2_9ARAC|nr:phosphoinositide phospholipase C [Trichonephila inaurata madagascariensis]
MAALSVNCLNTLPISIAENELIFRKLEQGSDVLKIFLKRKPERCSVCVKLETRQVVFLRHVAGRSVLESAVDLREVKEVRLGKNSKAFDRWPDETRKYQNNECFVIIYGNMFTLKSVSCVGQNNSSQDRI